MPKSGRSKNVPQQTFPSNIEIEKAVFLLRYEQEVEKALYSEGAAGKNVLIRISTTVLFHADDLMGKICKH